MHVARKVCKLLTPQKTASNRFWVPFFNFQCSVFLYHNNNHKKLLTLVAFFNVHFE